MTNRVVQTLLGLALLFIVIFAAVWWARTNVRNQRVELETKLMYMEIGIKYHDFYMGHQRGPKDAEEFKYFLNNAYRTAGNLAQLVGSGEFVVCWNGKLPPEEKMENFVLGYEKCVPETGGFVVLSSCSTRKMSPQEFAALEMMPQVSEDVAHPTK